MTLLSRNMFMFIFMFPEKSTESMDRNEGNGNGKVRSIKPEKIVLKILIPRLKA